LDAIREWPWAVCTLTTIPLSGIGTGGVPQVPESKVLRLLFWGTSELQLSSRVVSVMIEKRGRDERHTYQRIKSYPNHGTSAWQQLSS
jgi:hypothetical protein